MSQQHFVGPRQPIFWAIVIGPSGAAIKTHSYRRKTTAFEKAVEQATSRQNLGLGAHYVECTRYVHGLRRHKTIDSYHLADGTEISGAEKAHRIVSRRGEQRA